MYMQGLKTRSGRASIIIDEDIVYKDFDGDQVTAKMVYSVEANQELSKYQNSNGQFITLNGINGRHADKEAIQAMYNLTLVLPGTKLTDPVF